MKDDQLIIVGAGGHSKVVISTAIECGKEVTTILDDNESKWGNELFGIRYKDQ
jgi:FlaA1/EpsC-like NDP-sugar epimerase